MEGTISLHMPNYKRMQLTASTQSCGTRLCLLFRQVWQDTNNDNKYSTNVKKNNCNNSRPTTTWQSDWMSKDCLQATAAASPAPRPAFLTAAAPPVVAAIIPSKYQCCISIAAQISATAAFQVRKQSCKLSSRSSIAPWHLLRSSYPFWPSRRQFLRTGFPEYTGNSHIIRILILMSLSVAGEKWMHTILDQHHLDNLFVSR